MSKKFKVLISSLIVVLFISVISMLMPARSSFAYSGGLLNGTLPSTYSSNFTSTDMDKITNNTISGFFDMLPNGTITYNLSGPKNILNLGYKLSGEAISVNFYDVNNNLIKKVQLPATGGVSWTTINVLANNVSKVELEKTSATSSTSNSLIYEFDIFENLTPSTSSPSPSPITTPTPEPNADRAIFTVTLTTGVEKEFDLSMSEVTAFLNWYDSASGSASFGIDKKDNNKGPFSKRTEYVIHDQIITFEVSEYTVSK